MSIATYKIRRLKWRREGNAWFADTSIVSYEIVKYAGAWRVAVNGQWAGLHSLTLREAKAQCQEHFERKIRVFLVRVKQ